MAFSDTSEVFVYVSGYTCMLAYGGRAATGRLAHDRDARSNGELGDLRRFPAAADCLFRLYLAGRRRQPHFDETNTAFFFQGSRDRAAPHRHPANIRLSYRHIATFVLLHLAFPGCCGLMTRRPR